MAHEKTFIHSPFFLDEKHDISYTYNDQEGLHATNQSRSVLRARSVIATAFMRANISFFEHKGLLFYGEKFILSRDRPFMLQEAKEFVKIEGSATAEHIGYYLVPANANAGWAAQAGWAVAFMREGKTPEHTMYQLYRMLRHSISYLLKNEQLYGNVVSARMSLFTKNKPAEPVASARSY